MRGRARLSRRGWRWRRSPLRRRSDLVEALLGVVTAALLCATPLLGWWAGRSVDAALRREVAVEHTERSLVTATVVHSGTSAAASRGTEELHWTAPDHSSQTHAVASDLEIRQDGRIMLWTDRHGRLVPPPLDSATATTHAVLAGIAVGSAAAGLLVVARQLVLWRLMLSRMDSWEREWEKVDQDWGRAGAGG